MSYESYKILHLLGHFTLFFALGGMLIATYSGIQLKPKAKMMVFATHGIATLLILITGFAMAGKLHVMKEMPSWLQGKILIWVLLAVSISLVKRKGQIGWPLVVLILGLGTTAAYLALIKPALW